MPTLLIVLLFLFFFKIWDIFNFLVAPKEMRCLVRLLWIICLLSFQLNISNGFTVSILTTNSDKIVVYFESEKVFVNNCPVLCSCGQNPIIIFISGTFIQAYCLEHSRFLKRSSIYSPHRIQD